MRYRSIWSKHMQRCYQIVAISTINFHCQPVIRRGKTRAWRNLFSSTHFLPHFSLLHVNAFTIPFLPYIVHVVLAHWTVEWRQNEPLSFFSFFCFVFTKNTSRTRRAREKETRQRYMWRCEEDIRIRMYMRISALRLRFDTVEMLKNTDGQRREK